MQARSKNTAGRTPLRTPGRTRLRAGVGVSTALLLSSFGGLALGVLGTGAAEAAAPGAAAVAAPAAPAAPQSGSSQTLDSWGNYGSDGAADKSVDTPTPIKGVPADITQLSATNSDTFMLTASGQVWVVGAGHHGELGDGSLKNDFRRPVQVQFPAGVTIASLPTPMPFDTGLAIDTKGDVWGWGINKGGELCMNSTTQYDTPVELPFTNVTAATGAGGHATYDAGGTLFSCGWNPYGQLGNGDTTDSTVAVAVRGQPAGAVTTLTSGYGSTGALLANGTYWDWGLNARGQLGDGNETNSSTPVEVALPSNVTAVSEGGNNGDDGQTMVELANGKVEGWGANQYGQLCNGSQSAGVPTPEVITPPAGVTWPIVEASGASSYAIDSNNNLWACGSNTSGQIGNGVRGNISQVTPIEVLNDVLAVSGTSRNAAALAP